MVVLPLDSLYAGLVVLRDHVLSQSVVTCRVACRSSQHLPTGIFIPVLHHPAMSATSALSYLAPARGLLLCH